MCFAELTLFTARHFLSDGTGKDFTMKKILSLALALLLVLSTVVLFTGCNSEKPPVEMFALGGEKLAALFEGVYPANIDDIEDYNKASVSIGGIDLGSILGMEGESMPVSVDAAGTTTADGDSIVDLALDLGGEKIKAKLEMKDDKAYLSIPEASEYFLYAESLEALGAEDADLSLINDMTAKLEEAIKTLGDKYITETYIAKEDVDVTVFGEQITGAAKYTLTLDNAAIKDIATELLEAFETLAGEEIEMDDEGTDVSFKLSYVFSKEDLKQVNLSLVDGEGVGLTMTADVADNGTEKKLAAKITADDGEEPAEIDFNFSQKASDGKVEGTYEIVVPAAEGDTSIACTYTGTYTDSSADLDVTAKVAADGASFEVPFKLSTAVEDNKISAAFKIDTTIMGTAVKADITVTAEKDADAKVGEYDMSKGINVDNMEEDANSAALLTDLMTYAGNYENIGAILNMILMGDGTDMGGDDTYPEVVFEISQGDTEYISFNDDGTATYFTEYGVEGEADDDEFTILAEADIAVKLNDDGTADIGGISFNYEVEEFEGMVWYTFITEDLNTEIQINFYDDSDAVVWFYQYMEYEMDETTITLDYLDGTGPIALEYTLDEDAGTMTIGDVEYDYYSYEY